MSEPRSGSPPTQAAPLAPCPILANARGSPSRQLSSAPYTGISFSTPYVDEAGGPNQRGLSLAHGVSRLSGTLCVLPPMIVAHCELTWPRQYR